jgi:hypothetical protein
LNRAIGRNIPFHLPKECFFSPWANFFLEEKMTEVTKEIIKVFYKKFYSEIIDLNKVQYLLQKMGTSQDFFIEDEDDLEDFDKALWKAIRKPLKELIMEYAGMVITSSEDYIEIKENK